jgi:hypothetical protein
MVKVRAVLLDTVDGRRGEHSYEVPAEYTGSQLHLWTEGNYSCDCNRGRFLSLVAGGALLECSRGVPQIELVELWVGDEQLVSNETVL